MWLTVEKTGRPGLKWLEKENRALNRRKVYAWITEIMLVDVVVQVQLRWVAA